MTQLHIRPAAKEDLPIIHELIYALAEYEKLAEHFVLTVEQLRESLFGERPTAECLTAFFENEPAGFALFFTNYSTFLGKPGLYLEDLFVKPHFRKKGIGKALLRSLAQTASKRNYGRMEWAVLDWNTPSIEFYKSLGAKPMDEWTVFRLDSASIESLATGQV
jgi:GNAT superfamily N-acetyltransferase